jgi:ABC-type sugar transport system ATPase subunit
MQSILTAQRTRSASTMLLWLLGAIAVVYLALPIITHDLAEARALADRLVVLIAGRAVALGILAEVLATPPTATAAGLLGWANLLSIVHITSSGDGTEVTLSCGQRLLLPPGPGAPTAFSISCKLALRSDHLLLEGNLGAAGQAAEAASTSDVTSSLVGTLIGATDMGAYHTIRVALAGEPSSASMLVLACSPREWETLALAQGAAVRVRVPTDAARLVSG